MKVRKYEVFCKGISTVWSTAVLENEHPNN